jgi:serine/threonine protein phosphatase PrpC
LILTTIFTGGQNFCSRDDTIFCGVFDGHGPYGHLVAKRVRDLLPLKLGEGLTTEDGRVTSTGNIKLNTHDVASPEHIDKGSTAISSEAQQNGEYPETFPALRTSFLKAFRVMDRDLKLHKSIDCFFSGTTAVAVIKQVTETNHTIVLFSFRNILFWFQ